MTASTTPTLPPAKVIELWNTVAEDTGTLTQTLLRFSALILEAANQPSTDAGGKAAGGRRPEP